MKIRYLLIAAIVIILWESILGHFGALEYVDLFAVLSLEWLVLRVERQPYIFWLLVLGVVVDVIIVRWIGVSLVSNSVAIVFVLYLNRFFRLLEQGRFLITSIIYLSIVQIIRMLISTWQTSSQIEISQLINLIVINLIVSLFVHYLFGRKQRRDTITV